MKGLLRRFVQRARFWPMYANTYSHWQAIGNLYGCQPGTEGRGSLVAFDNFWRGYRDYLKARGLRTEQAIVTLHHLMLMCPRQTVELGPGECIFYARGMQILNSDYAPPS